MKHYVNKEFLILLLFLGVVNIPYFAPSFHFVPAHDTMHYVSNFFFFYNEYFLNHEIPLWIPYNVYGTTFDLFLLCPMSLSLYFVAFLGKWLRIENALFLFKTGLLIDQLVLLIGVYSLSKRVFSHRATTFWVCIGTIAVSGFWAVHIQWNLRMYYLIPLVLLWIIKFYDTGNFKYLPLAGLIGLFSLMGNGAYFAVLFLLLFSVFCLMLLLPKVRFLLSHARTFVKPVCVLLSVMLVIITIVFVRFTLNIFNYTMIYSLGRDQETGQVPLLSYLTYISSTPLAHRLELLYAVPSAMEQTFYIGLIPLIFLGYALLKANHNPIVRAMAVTVVPILLFSLGSLTFAAPLLYFICPLFKYFRHVELVLTPVKLLLILIAGFGLDTYLDSDRHGSKDRVISWVGFGLLVFLLCLDILAFRDKLPYNPEYYYHYEDPQGLKPFEFHYFALCLLCLFVFCLYRATKFGARNLWVILCGCFVVELLSYSYFLFFVFPITLSRVYKQENGTISSSRITKLFESSFDVASYTFQPERVQREQAYRLIDQRAPILTRYYGEKYSDNYGVAYVDPCFQDFYIDAVPLGVDRLLRARSGIPLDIPMISQGPPLPNHRPDDQPLLRAFGCGAPKLFLTSHVRIVAKLDEAASLIAQSQDLDTVPIILGNMVDKPHVQDGQTPASESPGTVQVTQFTANTLHVRANVSTSDGAWLIYLDAYHPNWMATVNGQLQPIFPANLAFKALHLNAGPNEVQLRFRGNRLSSLYAHICLYLGILSGYILCGTICYCLFPGYFESILRAITRRRKDHETSTEQPDHET
jgi:hypothetical protein